MLVFRAWGGAASLDWFVIVKHTGGGTPFWTGFNVCNPRCRSKLCPNGENATSDPRARGLAYTRHATNVNITSPTPFPH